MTVNKYNTASGNVLFLILIAVALFAALSYAVTSSSRTGNQGGSAERAKLKASQLIQYTSSVAQAVTRMRVMNRCAETEISFENPVVTGYVNANAPSNKECDVYEPDGGALSWRKGDDFRTNDFIVAPATFWSTDFWIFGGQSIQGLGTSASDLVMYLRLNADDCLAVNQLKNINSIPKDADIGANTFNGTYITPVAVLVDEAQGSDLTGHHYGCFDEVSIADTYFYYHVLIAR